MTGMLRHALLGAAGIVCVAAASPASAQVKSFSIPAQDAASGIAALGRQGDVQVAASRRDTRGRRTRAVEGSMTVEQALHRLLDGTGLVARPTGERTFTIVAATGPSASSASGAADGADDLAAAEGGDIVVTAQKQGAQRLQDVPMPITVVNTARLAENSQVLLRDYFYTVPGLNLAPNYLARQQLSIRGIAPGGATNPTVGIVVDDVPFGSSIDSEGGSYVPDFDPGSLAQIEVLRGPQGTIYAANSMGGLLRFVTRAPDPREASGRIEFGANQIRNGDTPGYDIRAEANIPLDDNLAVRVSGFTRLDAGYVDNPERKLEGVNKAVTRGVMGSALWNITPQASLRLNALYQRARADGSSEVVVAPGLGDLEQNFLPGTRSSDRKLQFYSATLDVDLGDVKLTSVTGLNINNHFVTDDRTSSLGGPIFSVFGVRGARYRLDTKTRKITEELRIAADLTPSLSLLGGGFYTHERSTTINIIDAEDVVTGQNAGVFFDFFTDPRKFEEKALFGTATWRPLPRLELQIGGRQSWQSFDFARSVISGPFVQAVLGQTGSSISPAIFYKASQFTYLGSARYSLGENASLYARVATGFRPGGPNSAPAIAQGAPARANPDTTTDYELGVKASLLGGKLFVDASVYYIDWDDIQIGLRPGNFTYSANGGTARSSGFDFALTAKPVSGMTIEGWVAYNDAKLTSDFPASATVGGRDGDRLPFAPRWSFYLSAEQAFPLGDGQGFLGGSIAYMGDRLGVFQGTASAPAPRQDLPAFGKGDLRVGYRQDGWNATLYVNNVTDKRGLINGGLGYVPTNAFTYIQPRTFGFSIAKDF